MHRGLQASSVKSAGPNLNLVDSTGDFWIWLIVLLCSTDSEPRANCTPGNGLVDQLYAIHINFNVAAISNHGDVVPAVLQKLKGFQISIPLITKGVVQFSAIEPKRCTLEIGIARVHLRKDAAKTGRHVISIEVIPALKSKVCRGRNHLGVGPSEALCGVVLIPG